MDDFGNRMKSWECNERFCGELPVIVRLDGKNFSKWTKKLKRPYDKSFSDLMKRVTISLMEESNATIGYTQSDEITLVLYDRNYKQCQIFFDGKKQKIISVLSSMCTAFFNDYRMDNMLMMRYKPAFFDCRVFQVPISEAANAVLWREMDASKNSISMLARHYFSHKELLKKSGEKKKEMLLDIGVDWDTQPSFFRRGSFFQRRKIYSKFESCDLAKLPEKHNAHKNPDLKFERSEIININMPEFSTVKNRKEVVLYGAIPEI